MNLTKKKQKSNKKKPGKLCLILDLDKTLIQSIINEPTDGMKKFMNIMTQTQKKKDFYQREGLESFFLQSDYANFEYICKFRNGLDQFLNSVINMYELGISTHGTNQYAKQILEFIDPKGIYFNNRVSSRSNDNYEMKKTLTPLVKFFGNSKIFEYGTKKNEKKRILEIDDGKVKEMKESLLKRMIIIDDREDIWEGDHKKHLIMCKPFDFFSKDMYENEDSEERIEEKLMEKLKEHRADNYLKKISDLLSNIHSKWADSVMENEGKPENVDVGDVMTKFKKKVFSNCNFVFSGLIPPTDLLLSHENSFFQKAREFGASYADKIADWNFSITHLVVQSALIHPTEKVRLCLTRRKDIKLVSDKWFWDSVFSWKKKSEAQYMMFQENNIPFIEGPVNIQIKIPVRRAFQPTFNQNNNKVIQNIQKEQQQFIVPKQQVKLSPTPFQNIQQNVPQSLKRKREREVIVIEDDEKEEGETKKRKIDDDKFIDSSTYYSVKIKVYDDGKEILQKIVNLEDGLSYDNFVKVIKEQQEYIIYKVEYVRRNDLGDLTCNLDNDNQIKYLKNNFKRYPSSYLKVYVI